MKYIIFLFISLVLILACNSNTTPCGQNPPNSELGISFNSERLKYGAPIIHSYLCFQSTSEKMESWGLAYELEDTMKGGYHAGKGIFHSKGALLDEKDIYRKRIDDSTLIMLGILTYVSKDFKVEFPSIWYDTLNASSVGLSKPVITERKFNARWDLSIEQADSILHSWGTSRTK